MRGTFAFAPGLARAVATAPSASGDRGSMDARRAAHKESRRAVVRGSVSTVATGGNSCVNQTRMDLETTHQTSRRKLLAAQVLGMTTTAQSMVPKESWAALEQASALPGDYAASARAVVKALTESLEFESVGEPTASERFRKAEPAKEAVKVFIKDWAQSPGLQGERSHDDIVMAVREISEFFKANGSRVAMDKATRDSVLLKLYDADQVLPKAPPTLAERLLGL